MSRLPPTRMPVDELPGALESILQARFPGAASAKIQNWTESPRGFSTETFLFDLDGVDESLHSGQETVGLVFRRPPDFDILPGFDLRRQYLVMQRLADSAVPVPRMRYLDAEGAALGTPYFVMDRIDDVLSVSDVPPYHEAGVYAETDDAGRAALWNGCVDMIAAVHRTDISDDRFRFCDLHKFGSTPPQRLANFLRTSLAWAAGDKPAHPTLLRALDWLDDHLYSPDRVTLVWGDSRMSNVLYDKTFRPAAVLDWEIAYLGDPGADIAWMYMTDWVSSPLPNHAPAPGTPTRDETEARYEERTGHRPSHGTFQDVTAALLLAVPLTRLTAKWQLDGVDLADVCAQRIDVVLQGD